MYPNWEAAGPKYAKAGARMLGEAANIYENENAKYRPLVKRGPEVYVQKREGNTTYPRRGYRKAVFTRLVFAEIRTLRVHFLAANIDALAYYSIGFGAL